MLPIYPPTDCATGEEPLTVCINFSDQDSVGFYTGYKETHLGFKENVYLTMDEQHPSGFWTQSSSFVPTEKVTIRTPVETFFLDAENKTMTADGKSVMNAANFTRHNEFRPLSTDSLFSLILLRNLNIPTDAVVNPIGGYTIKFALHPELEDLRGDVDSHDNYFFGGKSFTYSDGHWYKHEGDNEVKAVFTDTPKLDLDNEKSGLTILQPNRHTPRQGVFTFTQPEKAGSFNWHQKAGVHIRTSVHLGDPEMGKKFFDGLGVDYDVYDTFPLLENGDVDNAGFLEGKHNFGVAKRICYFFDFEKIAKLLSLIEERLTDEDLEDENIDGQLYNLKNTLANINCYIGVSDEPIEDLIGLLPAYRYDHIGWCFRDLLNAVKETSGSLLGEKEEAVDDDVINPHLLFDATKFITSAEIWVPFFTPRIGNKEAGVLKDLLDAGHFPSPHDILGIPLKRGGKNDF